MSESCVFDRNENQFTKQIERRLFQKYLKARAALEVSVDQLPYRQWIQENISGITELADRSGIVLFIEFKSEKHLTLFLLEHAS